MHPKPIQHITQHSIFPIILKFYPLIDSIIKNSIAIPLEQKTKNPDHQGNGNTFTTATNSKINKQWINSIESNNSSSILFLRNNGKPDHSNNIKEYKK